MGLTRSPGDTFSFVASEHTTHRAEMKGTLMKLVRCLVSDGSIHTGAVEDDGTIRRLAGDLYGQHHVTDEVLEPVKLLAPVAVTQIWGVGLNYHNHAIETGMPVPSHPIIFAKGTNSVQHPDEPIVIPDSLSVSEVDYEGELAVVIGKEARNVSRKDALDYVLGFTCANDISARDWQLRLGGGQWSRGKTFDTFCPMGTYLLTTDELDDAADLGIRTYINGALVQNGNTSDMIFDVPALIEFLSAGTTLSPGTLVLTGTPAGVGMSAQPPRWLSPGDEVVIDIDRLGALRNPVVAEAR